MGVQSNPCSGVRDSSDLMTHPVRKNFRQFPIDPDPRDNGKIILSGKGMDLRYSGNPKHMLHNS